MTPREIQDELKAVTSMIRGRNPLVSVFLSVVGSPILVSVYGNWPESSALFSQDGDDWIALFAGIRQKWADFHAQYAKDTTRRIALEIIRLTADSGTCTNAALRMKFSSADVGEYGAAACEDANRIASNGPFSIEIAGKSNGAPGDEQEAAE